MTRKSRDRRLETIVTRVAGGARRPKTPAPEGVGKMGRPTDHTSDMAREISDGMLEGNSLRAAATRWASEIVAIADDTTLGPHDRRIRIEARKW